ncbi:hypothetical protein BC828DRAFT_437465 [Blastocladiella britannica]|nr:hypothetical protein BC828DRAFT_437465 [Blastocladiella britannica]
MPINALPSPILARIVWRLNERDAVKLRRTCRALRGPLTHLTRSKESLLVIMAAVTGNWRRFWTAIHDPKAYTTSTASGGSGVTQQLAELLVRFRVTSYPVWDMLRQFHQLVLVRSPAVAAILMDRPSITYNLSVAKLMLVAAQVNAAEVLPLVAQFGTLAPVPALSTLRWRAEDTVAERVYIGYGALLTAAPTDTGAAVWRTHLAPTLWPELAKPQPSTTAAAGTLPLDWLATAHALRGHVAAFLHSGMLQYNNGGVPMVVDLLNALTELLKPFLATLLKSPAVVPSIDPDLLPADAATKCCDDGSKASYADQVRARESGQALAGLSIGCTLLDMVRIYSPRYPAIVEKIVQIVSVMAYLESAPNQLGSGGTGAMWSSEMMSFLLNDCLAPTATVQQARYALNALGVMSWRAHGATYNGARTALVLEALARRFDAVVCQTSASDEGVIVALARALESAFRVEPTNEYPYSAAHLALSNVLALCQSPHPHAAAFAAKALGHILSSPWSMIPVAALGAGAHSVLVSMLSAPALPARRAATEAVAQWIRSGNHTSILVELKVIASLLTRLETETDHWTRRWLVKCFHRASKFPRLALVLLLDRSPDSGAMLLMQCCAETVACPMRATPYQEYGCDLVHAQLRLVESLVTFAAHSKKPDVPSNFLSDEDSVPTILGNAIRYLGLIKKPTSKHAFQVLRIVRTCLQWEREGYGSWREEIKGLRLLIPAIQNECPSADDGFGMSKQIDSLFRIANGERDWDQHHRDEEKREVYEEELRRERYHDEYGSGSGSGSDDDRY